MRAMSVVADIRVALRRVKDQCCRHMRSVDC